MVATAKWDLDALTGWREAVFVIVVVLVVVGVGFGRWWRGTDVVGFSVLLLLIALKLLAGACLTAVAAALVLCCCCCDWESAPRTALVVVVVVVVADESFLEEEDKSVGLVALISSFSSLWAPFTLGVVKSCPLAAVSDEWIMDLIVVVDVGGDV